MQAAARAPGEGVLGELFAVLSASEVVVPVRGEGPEGPELAVQEDTDGAVTFFAFSDVQAMRAAAPSETPHVTMSSPVLARTVLAEPRATLVVDAGESHAGRLSRPQLEALRDGLSPTSEETAETTENSDLRLFPLQSELAEPLVAAVRDAAASEEAVHAVHAFEGSFRSGVRHRFLGVAFIPGADPSSREPALRAMVEVSRPHLAPEEPIDIIALEGEVVDPALAAGQLLWQRGELRA